MRLARVDADDRNAKLAQAQRDRWRHPARLDHRAFDRPILLQRRGDCLWRAIDALRPDLASISINDTDNLSSFLKPDVAGELAVTMDRIRHDGNTMLKSEDRIRIANLLANQALESDNYFRQLIRPPTYRLHSSKIARAAGPAMPATIRWSWSTGR